MTIAGKVILHKGKEHSIERFHPWIFSGAISRMEGAITDGSWVEVVNIKNKTLGFGHYQNGSIAIRVLSFGETPNENFWHDRFRKALQLRNSADLPSTSTTCFRLIHGEGDGLPGLIIDYYDGAAVVQAHSVGMHEDRKEIASSLKAAMGDDLKAVYYKSQSTLPGKMRDRNADEYL